jgi:hypothetical protein
LAGDYDHLVIDRADPLDILQDALQKLFQIERGDIATHNQDVLVAVELEPTRTTMKVTV